MAEAKKPHWTQTPEGRARLSESIKKAYNKRKVATEIANGTRKKSGPKPKPEHPPRITLNESVSEENFAYALGYVECWLETFAKSAGVPPEALTTRMGKVLQSKNKR